MAIKKNKRGRKDEGEKKDDEEERREINKG
jgi:hypothetical protein